ASAHMWKRVEFESGGPSGANAAPIRRGAFGRSAFSAESAASSGVFGAVRFVLDVAAGSSTSSAGFGTRYPRRVRNSTAGRVDRTWMVRNFPSGVGLVEWYVSR